MESTKNNTKKILIGIIIFIIIIAIGTFVALKIKDNNSSNNNTTTQNNTTNEIREDLVQPSGTGTPMTNMPVIDSIPTNE